jgi:hypothetical protein
LFSIFCQVAVQANIAEAHGSEAALGQPPG